MIRFMMNMMTYVNLMHLVAFWTILKRFQVSGLSKVLLVFLSQKNGHRRGTVRKTSWFAAAGPSVFRIWLFQFHFHVILIGWGWTFSAVLHMCFWNVLDFTQNMELLCVAGCCCLPFAGSHWHWKDDRIFYCRPCRGCSQRRTRWKPLFSRFGITWMHGEVCAQSPMIPCASLVTLVCWVEARKKGLRRAEASSPGT